MVVIRKYGSAAGAKQETQYITTTGKANRK